MTMIGAASSSSPALAQQSSSDLQPKVLLSLADCATRLRAASDLGARAPAHITLKRWSAAGVLEAAVVREEGKRPLYDLALVRDIALAQMAERWVPQLDFEAAEGQAAAAPAPATQTSKAEVVAAEPSSAGGPTIEDLADRVDRIAASQDALRQEMTAAIQQALEQSARLAAAAENLEATRRSLMVRTDAEITSLRSQLNLALQRGGAGGGDVVAVAKLTTVLNRVEDLLRDRQP